MSLAPELLKKNFSNHLFLDVFWTSFFSKKTPIFAIFRHFSEFFSIFLSKLFFAFLHHNSFNLRFFVYILLTKKKFDEFFLKTFLKNPKMDILKCPKSKFLKNF